MSRSRAVRTAATMVAAGAAATGYLMLTAPPAPHPPQLTKSVRVVAPRVLQPAPTAGAEEVGPRDRIRITFTQPMAPTPEPVLLTPPAAYSATWEEAAVVVTPDHLEAGTTYEVRVNPGLEGQSGVHIEPSPVARFTVRPAPRVAAVELQDPLGPNGTIRIAFDQAMDTAEVERGFRLEPPALGRFEWPDPQTLLFRPDHLRWRTEYRLQLGGASQLGDDLVAVERRFQTADLPPLSPPGGACGILSASVLSSRSPSMTGGPSSRPRESCAPSPTRRSARSSSQSVGGRGKTPT